MRNIVIRKSFKAITANLILAVFFVLSFFSYQIANALDLPKIITRSQWGADETKVISPAKYAEINKFIIHHTASSELVQDSDGSGEYKNMIKNIFLYHINGREWNDIGYNYLVDPNGNIYEGRNGGNGVVGVHAGSYNEGSIGISILGTYGGNVNGEYLANPLTYKIIKSLEKLIGWVAANNGISLNKINGQNPKGENIDGVIGHRDVSATNCPGDELYQKLGSIQNDAITYANTYKNYAYQIGEDKAVYILADGYKMKFDSAKNLPTAYQNNIIKPISANQLNKYQYKDIIIYPDGSLLQKFDEPAVYYLENGEKRALSMSGEDFIKMGFKVEDLKKVFESDLKIYNDSKIIKYGPDGSLLSSKNGDVYFIEKGQKRKFTSAQLFEYLNYQWTDIKEDPEIDFYLEGLKMIYPDGILATSDKNNKVYLIENEQKREITSLVLFDVLNYEWENVISINEDELNHFPVGAKMVYSDGTLIKRKDYPVIYKIEKGTKKRFTSLALFEATKSDWADVLDLSKEEFVIYPDGGVLKYPEGTLIKQAGDDKIYTIKNGEAEWVETLEEFKAAGYKWSDLIEITVEEADLYFNIGNKEIKNNSINDSSNNNTTVNEEPLMKVAIYSTTSEDILITANGNYSVHYYNSADAIYKTENKSSGEQAIISYFNSANYVKFVPSSENVILEILSYEDLSWNREINDNKFRGNLEIKYSDISNKLWIINKLLLEDYVNGISEASNDSPEEYLKAFSAIARTYAMYYIKEGGKHTGELFHLKNSRNGNGNDQHYKGYNFEMRALQIVTANKSTAGHIINYNNSPIVAAYSSDSGGITKSGCTVLSANYCSADYTYLNGGVKDSENTKHDPAKVAVSHGAGMSAVGACQMAEDGSDWMEIIKHYYLGVEVEKYY